MRVGYAKVCAVVLFMLLLLPVAEVGAQHLADYPYDVFGGTNTYPQIEYGSPTNLVSAEWDAHMHFELVLINRQLSRLTGLVLSFAVIIVLKGMVEK